MKIGVLSDTHGCIDTVERVLSEFESRGVETLIHCGDIDDAATVKSFARWDVHFVFGNCDADRLAIRRAIDSIGATLHEPFGHLQIEGKQLAWLHGDQADLMRSVEYSGGYDYLFFGHTHVAEHRMTSTTQVINPGALFRARQRSCLVLDLPSGALETITLPAR